MKTLKLALISLTTLAAGIALTLTTGLNADLMALAVAVVVGIASETVL